MQFKIEKALNDLSHTYEISNERHKQQLKQVK